MKRLDVMQDVETLGNENTPVITQVSAVLCNLSTGEKMEEFNMLVNPTSCVKIGLNCTGSTVDWWLTQESDVLNKVIIKSIQEGYDIKVVLEEYSNFLNSARKHYDVKNIQVWGNGLLADNKWLESAYMAAKIDLPWAYYEGKDVRTLVDLGISMGINPKKTLVFKGQKHNAIDDCKHQIDYCTPIVQLADSVPALLKLKAEQEKKKEENSDIKA